MRDLIRKHLLEYIQKVENNQPREMGGKKFQET
jgi:hypothetical protein